MKENLPPIERMTRCRKDRTNAAALIITKFIEEHGLEHDWNESLPEFNEISVLIAPNQSTIYEYLLEIGEISGDLPAGLIAASLPSKIIIANADTVRKLRPEYLRIRQGWTRLLAHEYAHFLHQNLVGGKEELLGPRWFFEGFACFLAGQRLGRNFDDKPVADVLAAIKVVGRAQYPVYEAAFRYFANKLPIRTLVEKAGLPGFETWLSKIDDEPSGPSSSRRPQPR